MRKQEYNPKKFYGIDTGLQNAVAFKLIDEKGKLFENMIYLEIRKRYKDIFYWEEETEADFIVKEGEAITQIINASYSIESEQTLEREVRSLNDAMYSLNHVKSTLVTADKKIKDKKITTEAGKIDVMSVIDFKKALSIA